MRRRLVAAFLLAGALPAAAKEAVVNGFRMHYEDRGRGEPVVFIHGFTLDSTMWNDQRGFAKKYRVVEQPEKFNRDLDAFLTGLAPR